MICIRRISFTAAHSYHQPHRLSPDESRQLFGDAARPEPHGHDYQLDVAIEGTIDPRHGMVVNLAELKAILERTVLRDLDHRFLNVEVPFFHSHSPTSENILLYLWDRIDAALGERCALARLHLRENPTLSAELNRDGEQDRPLMLLTRLYDFSASHRLHSPQLSAAENETVYGKCNRANGHGHNYGLEVTVRGPVDPRTGTVMDLRTLDRVVTEEVLDRYDHRHLNLDVPDFDGLSPTSENVARVIFRRLKPRVPRPAELYRIRLQETARNTFECFGEE